MKNNLMTQIKNILLVSRPFSWVNTAVPFALGLWMANQSLSPAFWLGSFYFLFPYNLLMYGVNDIYDYESDIKNPRKDSIEGGIVAPSQRRQLWAAIAITNLPFLIYFLLTGDAASNVTLLFVVFFCFSYSFQGLRFKEKPVLDSINSALHFVSPLVFGLMYGKSATLPWLLIAAFMCWGMASQALGAIQDIGPDRAADIKSIATYFGAKKTLTFTLVLYSLAALITVVAFWPIGIFFGLLLSTYIINALFFRKYKSDAQHQKFRRSWKNFLWLNWLVGFWLAQVALFAYDPFTLGSGRFALVAVSLIALGGLQLVVAVYNIIKLRRPKTDFSNIEYPKVSILIHALDQADNINSTLLAAIGQSYPEFEILFTDLGSQDQTLKLAEGFQDARLKILDIAEPEEGWEIDAWAADQLAKEATGDIVVFLSADTILMPNTIAAITKLMHDKQLDIASLLPADQNKSLAQKLVLSQNYFLLLGSYPAAWIEHKHPEQNLAYSGIIAMTRHAFGKLGGFYKIRKSPLAEMELARQASKSSLSTGFFLASDMATAQNHATMNTIVQQNIQRYYPALQFNMPLASAGILFGSFLFITPGIGLAGSLIFSNSQQPIWLAAYLAGLLPRIAVSSNSRQGFIASIFYPVTYLLCLGTIGLSMFHYELFKPRWQSRTELH